MFAHAANFSVTSWFEIFLAVSASGNVLRASKISLDIRGMQQKTTKLTKTAYKNRNKLRYPSFLLRGLLGWHRRFASTDPATAEDDIAIVNYGGLSGRHSDERSTCKLLVKSDASRTLLARYGKTAANA